jgi:hypothetical protein
VVVKVSLRLASYQHVPSPSSPIPTEDDPIEHNEWRTVTFTPPRLLLGPRDYLIRVLLASTRLSKLRCVPPQNIFAPQAAQHTAAMN